MSKNNIFKQLQTIFFSKTNAPIIVQFHMMHDMTPEFQNCKIGSDQGSKMAAITKYSKNNKIDLSKKNRLLNTRSVAARDNNDRAYC